MLLLLACARPEPVPVVLEQPIPKVGGCGKQSPPWGQLAIDAGPEGDGLRSFFVALPEDYDPQREYALVVGFPGSNFTGERMRRYLDLEEGNSDTVFVYPDPRWRHFPEWSGTTGGWLLGPEVHPAQGEQDLVFVEALLDHMEANYCIDRSRVFATGQSWGGDMSHVVACYLGERFTASVPVAAARPYWVEDDEDRFVDCPGQTQVWTMFGEGDDYFGEQHYPGQFGDECRDFWLDERTCQGLEGREELPWGEPGECVRYEGCSSEVRYCLYDEASGHQLPPYYARATMDWFRSF